MLRDHPHGVTPSTLEIIMAQALAQPPDRRALLAGIGGLAAGAFLTAGRAEAGPLNPPAAPASTPGPEPRIAINQENTAGDGSNLFRITQPGSYYLTGNVLGVAGRSGILVTVGNVCIDLCGFELRGVAASAAGIMTDGGHDNIVIRNGIICDWGDEGINLAHGATDTTGVGRLIEGVMAAGNNGDGIRTHLGAVVRNCTANNNVGYGIWLGGGASIDLFYAEGNTGTGIQAGGTSAVTNCVARLNGGQGIASGNQSTISNCSALGNNSDGIRGGEATAITNCSASGNLLSGITVVSGSITNCVSELNRNHGFFLAFHGRISGCSTHTNWYDGIQVLSNCVVEGNLCSGDGFKNDGTSTPSAGIHAFSSLNRLMGNTCVGCVRGIEVVGTKNLITGNGCSDNLLADYTISAGNRYGPIINVTDGGAAAVNGNSAPSTTLTTDPCANFAF
jgi:hypothetical protein